MAFGEYIIQRLSVAMINKSIFNFKNTTSNDQAAYRKGYSTDDHLITVALLIERSWEFQSPLWFALVDFEKSVRHGRALSALDRA